MKNILSIFSISLLLLFGSINVYADSQDNTTKKLSMGIGTYASVIRIDINGVESDDYSGLAFTFGYAASDNFMLRGTYFSLEHEDFSILESTGIDLLAYIGTGLATQGFKAYIGGGYFKDTLKIAGFSESFNGLQFGGGIGYNWNQVSLDLIIGIRDASDYEDFYNNLPPVTNDSITVVSSSLLLSYRF